MLPLPLSQRKRPGHLLNWLQVMLCAMERTNTSSPSGHFQSKHVRTVRMSTLVFIKLKILTVNYHQQQFDLLNNNDVCIFFKPECGQGTISSLGIEYEDTPAVKAHSTVNEGQEHVSGIGQTHVTTKVIWVAVVVFIVIWVICFWYFRRSSRAAENVSEPRSGRRRSVGPSSANQRKEKRLSST